MPPIIKGEVRRSQMVTTYGVGSVIALGDESFIVGGIDLWNISDPNLQEPRLERELGVRGFVSPPASGDDKKRDVPVFRFPEVYSCPNCKRLAPHSWFTTLDSNQCGTCEVTLVPSRFVVACPNGHIDDFPYFQWVHAGMEPVDTRHEMSIESSGVTASLADVVIRCSCNKKMDLGDSFRRDALRGIARCRGRLPWLRTAPVECKELPRVLQRGGSNVWLPQLQSAISIPPWSEGALRQLAKQLPVLTAIPDDALEPTVASLAALGKWTTPVADLVAAVKFYKSGDAGKTATSDAQLRREEYAALTRGNPERPIVQEFVAEPVEIERTSIRRWFRQVMAVKRLREVRVLTSFTRIDDPGPTAPASRRAPLYSENPGWLPGIEVSGEGLFLVVDHDRLARWEADPKVRARAAKLDAAYRKRAMNQKEEPDRAITPRLVMLHSTAHLLISQWSLECGYPAAALRERVYASDDMAGILIYTATTDSAGSLGGVVALGTPERISASIEEMLERASWCSSDPLCSEVEGSGVDGLNLAACHACALLPEVSCEEMNLLLDRALVSETPGAHGMGFFGTVFD